MTESYLWDKSGPKDPLIAGIERSFAAMPSLDLQVCFPRRRGSAVGWLALAASVVVFMLLGLQRSSAVSRSEPVVVVIEQPEITDIRPPGALLTRATPAHSR